MNNRIGLTCLVGLMLSAHASLAQNPTPTATGAWDPAVSKSGDVKSRARESKSNTAEAAKLPTPGLPTSGPPATGAVQKAAPAAAVPTAAALPATPAAALLPAATRAATAAPPVVTGSVSASPAPQATKSGDWSLECSPASPRPLCTLRQIVGDSKNRRIIEMRAAVVRDTAFLEVIVPVGISIPYGVSVDVAEGKKLPAQLVDCGQTGCRAVLPLNAANIVALKSAATLAVTFQDSKSGKVISISGSPKGFDPGIAKVTGGS